MRYISRFRNSGNVEVAWWMEIAARSRAKQNAARDIFGENEWKVYGRTTDRQRRAVVVDSGFRLESLGERFFISHVSGIAETWKLVGRWR